MVGNDYFLDFLTNIPFINYLCVSDILNPHESWNIPSIASLVDADNVPKIVNTPLFSMSLFFPTRFRL